MSHLFQTSANQHIENNVFELLQANVQRFSGSPRAVGDAIEAFIKDHTELTFAPYMKRFETRFERRAMADFEFTDVAGYAYTVDVKTHRSDTKFNMPNLTSVQRLSKFYSQEGRFFAILLIKYTFHETAFSPQQVLFFPIEALSWDCLTLGALGWGQIQIANANRLIFDWQQTRKAWMLQFFERLQAFYALEKSKIEQRQRFFESLQKEWQNK